MEKVNAFYKLIMKRDKLEEMKESYDNSIKDLRDQAKKIKKSSTERQDLMKRVQEAKNSEEYKMLKLEITTMNYCINTIFYS